MLKGICRKCSRVTGYSSDRNALGVCQSCGSADVEITENMQKGEVILHHVVDDMLTMRPEMAKKRLLKVGRVVNTIGLEYAFVLEDRLIFSDGWIPLTDYDTSLKVIQDESHVDISVFDIEQVFDCPIYEEVPGNKKAWNFDTLKSSNKPEYGLTLIWSADRDGRNLVDYFKEKDKEELKDVGRGTVRI